MKRELKSFIGICVFVYGLMMLWFAIMNMGVLVGGTPGDVAWVTGTFTGAGIVMYFGRRLWLSGRPSTD
ncbi:MAG: hypothetical protein SYNGOMJ08_00187 [Candidatus Syntrophoarchaeum sp. GoM_oil]|nr:MAG: hypothetical protein SYNGOMJ08_00187 [Candidatus Syntrophoarchaeum sp. GoM_oil]